jgi:hypothetical protein
MRNPAIYRNFLYLLGFIALLSIFGYLFNRRELRLQREIKGEEIKERALRRKERQEKRE